MSNPYPPVSPEMLPFLPHNDAGPTLLVSAWTLTAVATVFLGLRLYCKFLGNRRLYWDDFALIGAWVALIIDDALATDLVKEFGFGKHSWDLPPAIQINLDKFVLVLELRATFTIIAIAWTKTAFAITLLRLTDGWTKRFVWFIIISMNIALGISGLLRWVDCTPVQKSWTPSVPGTCLPQRVSLNADIFSGAYSACMDLTLAMLPWKVIWKLQMRRAEKMGIAVAMSMGVFAGGVAIVKTIKLPNLASPDLYNATELFIWDITEASVTMMAACIPILRILLREVRASTRRYYITDEQNSTELQSRKNTAETRTSRATFSKQDFSRGDSFQELKMDFGIENSLFPSWNR